MSFSGEPGSLFGFAGGAQKHYDYGNVKYSSFEQVIE